MHLVHVEAPNSIPLFVMQLTQETTGPKANKRSNLSRAVVGEVQFHRPSRSVRTARSKQHVLPDDITFFRRRRPRGRVLKFTKLYLCLRVYFHFALLRRTWRCCREEKPEMPQAFISGLGVNEGSRGRRRNDYGHQPCTLLG